VPTSRAYKTITLSKKNGLHSGAVICISLLIIECHGRGRCGPWRLRTPCDSLSKVKDDMEDFYLDNTIQLTLCRDGNVYFDKKFTKATFAASIDKDFYANAILDGIRFLKVEPGQGLVFSFAVSYPDSDMSVPFLMTISDQGTYTFVKNENLDHEDTDSAFFADDGV